MHRRVRRFNGAAEPLEARHVLTAELLVTELAANGQAALIDEDGDRSDWIELYNNGDEPADLTGWYLTDDSANLSRWQFPNVRLRPQEYLLVYASGKDRSDPDEPLHTNFRLTDQGEYFALVQPDGKTVEFDYGAMFAAQPLGATYGIRQSEQATTLLPFGAESRYSVADPDGRSSRSRSWTKNDFDDSTWHRGPGALGFDTTDTIDDLIMTDVESLMLDRNASIYVRQTFEFDPGADATRVALRIDLLYDDAYVVYLNGKQLVQANISDQRPSNQATATAERAESDAPRDIESHYFLLSDLDMLDGENVLAVHGLNIDPSDADFLISAEIAIISPGELDVTQGNALFAQPTPGRPNGGETVVGKLPEVSISLPHGFYETKQQVTLSSDSVGASLVYTTDGSTPDFSNGTVVESADRAPSVTLAIDSVTVLRVAAFLEGWLPSNVETATYLFPMEVIRQSSDGSPPPGWPTGPVNDQQLVYGMDPDIVDSDEYGPLMLQSLTQIPSISLVTDRDHLFDSATGFYVNGVLSRTGNNEADWERPVSMELIQPDGTEGFQIDAGARMRGGAGRHGQNSKHSFRIFFRSLYGESQLNYPLFGEEGVEFFDKIDFRAPSVPSWSFCFEGRSNYCREHTILRDVFGRDTQRDMGQPYTRSRYYNLYLNGQYWGVYQSQERADAAYAASYFGGTSDDYDVIKVESFPHATAVTNGTIDAWRSLWQAAVDGFEEQADYLRVQGLNPDGSRDPDFPVLLDVNNLIDYMIAIFYDGDLDGPITDWGNNDITNNWFGIRNRNGDDGFKFFIHDGEWALHNVQENRLGPWPAGRTFQQSNPQWIHQQLMANVDYRIRFADRAYRHLSDGGVLSPARVRERLDARVAELETPIIAESARWGDTWRDVPYTQADWLAAVNRIRENYFPQRGEILIEQFRNAWLDEAKTTPAPLYLGTFPPHFDLPGGLVPPGTQLTMTAEDPIYFTLDGSDPRASVETVDWIPLLSVDDAVRYFVPADASLEQAWNQPDFDESAWAVGTNGIGFGSRYEDIVKTDVEELMLQVNSTIYTRFSFDVDPLHADRLRLQLNLDDGAVAYLNGIEVSRHFVSDDRVDWESRAASSTRNIRRFDIDLSSYLSILRPGRNVLAIQGLNFRSTDRDFLLLPELQIGNVTDSGIHSEARRYAEPITIDGNRIVRARALRSGSWSPLIEAVFDTQAVPLRIDEIMYHPANPSAEELALGYSDDDDFEYIEFVNISDTQALDVTGFRIRGGVEFEFPPTLLPPGHRTVVVRRADAFVQRYGTGPRIAGQYMDADGANRLSNSGESLQVYDALGLLVQELTYSDDWFPDADGGGNSLQIVDVRRIGLDAWSHADAWRASLIPSGTPGTPDRLRGDANGDGVFSSTDLVLVFQRNEFEDGIPLNSTFDEGDWNGDGEFDSSDLVHAFQQRQYIAAAILRPAIDSVFEDDVWVRRKVSTGGRMNARLRDLDSLLAAIPSGR
ncbi:MAG: lamin tail domain-containing protein [Planctomycetales bacterium]|nr:lamin tail domain-containing protein [Planctomycetales bacterium]